MGGGVGQIAHCKGYSIKKKSSYLRGAVKTKYIT
jgi:hypothetical protein